ncbi:TPA: hypothetical protein KRH38_003384 [Clostridioides difficile]|uniref:hypothetical protein n=1 Tax=Clostridioides difficile TaxID=1496 RepID=UPI001C166883|nr:hypothetical protein [Clostridioides difficile]
MKKSKKILRRQLEFIEISKKVGKLFKDRNISLSFEGYKTTLEEYLSCNEYDLENLYHLIIDSNLWSHYFGDLIGLTDNIYSEKISKSFFLEMEHITKKEEIKDLKIEINLFKVFLKRLKIQKKMFDRIHYHCSKMYMDANNNLNFRSFE